MKLWRLSGHLLFATGIIHLLVGLLIIKPVIWYDIFNDGIVNGITPHEDRLLAFFFMLPGFFWISFGYFCNWIIKIRNAPLPSFFGWHLLIISVAGCILIPASGFWLLIIQGIIIVCYGRK